jgi:hypothetical protein
MELGSFDPLVDLDFDCGIKRKKKGSLSKKVKDIESLYCNTCKKITNNAQEIVYNYNSNVSKWLAKSICSVCFSNKSAFVKRSN